MHRLSELSFATVTAAWYVLTLCTRSSDHRAERGACHLPDGFRRAPRVFYRRYCRKVVPSSSRLDSTLLGHRLVTRQQREFSKRRERAVK